MKQTNGAVTLLLSAFKSIYRNAYMKGIASAVVLTAGLSAGAANATITGTFVTDHTDEWQDVILVGETSSPEETPTFGDAQKYAHDITVGANANLTNGSNSGDYNSLFVSGTLLVTDGGKITIDSNQTYMGIIGSDTATGNPNYTGSLIVNGDTSQVSLTESFINMKSVQLNGGTVTIGGQIYSSSNAGTNYAGVSQIYATDSFTVNGATINLGNYSQLGIGISTSVANGATSSFTMTDGTINFKDSGTGSGFSGGQNYTSMIRGFSNSTLSFNGGDINVDTSAHGSIVAPVINLAGADVDNKGTLYINGGVRTVATPVHSAGVINMTAGTFTNESAGELVIGAGSTVDNPATKDINEEAITTFNLNGGTINNAGTITVNGVLKVNGGTLASTADTSKINVSGAASQLEISTTALNAYLADSDNTGDDKKGAVNVSGAGATAAQYATLVLTDDSVELGGDDADVSFASTANTAEGLFISNATIRGNAISVTTDIQNLGGKVTIEAKTLSLGDGDNVEALSDVSATNKVSYVATGDLNLNGKDRTFTIDEDLTLRNPDEEFADINAGNGDDIVVDGANVFVNGNYRTDRTLTLDGAGIYVGKTEKTANFSGDTTFEVNGTLTTATGNSAINVSAGTDNEGNAYTSTLDLTGATLKAGTGTGRLNLVSATNGTIQVTGDQLTSVLDADNPDTGIYQFSLLENGKLAVNGDFSADFDAFTQTAAGHKVVINANAAGKAKITADTATLTRSQTSTQTSLNLYNAILDVNTLKVSNLHTHAEVVDGQSKQVQDKDVTLVSGSYIVTDALTSSNELIKLGTEADVTLGTDKTTTGTDVTHAISSDVEVGTGATLTVAAGDWVGKDLTIAGGNVTVAGETFFNAGDENYYAASLTGDHLKVTTGKLTIGDSANIGSEPVDTYGDVEFKTIETTGTEAVIINEGSSLTLLGDKDAKLADGTTADPLKGINYSDDGIKVSGGTLVFGEVASSALFGEDSKGDLTVQANQIDLADGEVQLTYAADTSVSFTKDELTTIKNDLFGTTGGDLLTGVLNVGNAHLDIDGLENNRVTWENFKPFADVHSDVTSTELLNTTVTDFKSADNTDGFRGQVGSLITDGVNDVRISEDSSFNKASLGEDGNYFAMNKEGKQVSFNINDGKTLTFRNGGVAGGVTFNGNNAALEVDSPSASTTFNGNVGSNGTGTFTTNGETIVNGDVNVNELVLNGGSLTSGQLADGTRTGNVTVTDYAGLANASLTTNVLNVNGELEADNSSVTADTVNITNGGQAGDSNLVEIYGNGTLAATYVFVTDGSADVTINVGIDTEEGAYDPVEQKRADDTYAYGTGTIETSVLGLKGATLNVDPAFGQRASVVAVGRFDSDTKHDVSEPDAGIMDGKINVGRNGIVAVGVEGRAEVESILASYLDGNGSLSTGNYGAIMYVGNQMEIADGNGIAMTTESLYGDAENKGFLNNEYVTKGNQVGLTPAGIADGIYFGDNTGLFIDEDAFSGNGAAIHFQGSDVKLVADGGDIVVMGDYRAQEELNIFSDVDNDADATRDSSGVNVVDAEGNTITAEGEGITVKTENGMLIASLNGDNAGKVTLSLNKEYRSILSGASDPVARTIAAYAAGYNDFDAAEPKDTLTSGVWLTDAEKAEATDVEFTGVTKQVDNGDGTTTTLNEVKYSNALLAASLNTGNGSAAEAAARMAVYGGAVEAALVAGQTSSDAIASRMGMGNPSSVLTYADNADGAGIWLAPVYRNHESDGFDAEGVDYGADLDLYGVALGVDYTFAQGFRAGVMFNIGSGDADGQGAGSSVSNDFDYWGVGVYGGYAYENFSITADLGYTVVDNDLDASSGYADIGSMEASTDTESLSLGVTAQYKFALDALDITPHVGARFTRIDMDDYSVNSKAGTLAEFSADSMNVFSVPVGVSFSKDIVSGDWSVQPALDLVVTANTGDDEFDGDVAWSGVSNLTTAISTEVLDSFTYGANLGVSVKNASGLSLGLGVNYVGSDNTDEFGAQASVRYAF